MTPTSGCPTICLSGTNENQLSDSKIFVYHNNPDRKTSVSNETRVGQMAKPPSARSYDFFDGKFGIYAKFCVL